MSEENGNQTGLDIVLENLLNKPDDNKDLEMENHQDLRREMLAALLGNSLDKDTANAARALVADLDKSILARRKLEQDKTADQNRNELLNDLYQKMLTEHGSSMSIAPIVEATNDQRKLDDSILGDFTFTDDETIIGDDTENSYEV